MAMLLKAGNYSFPVGGVRVGSESEIQYSENIIPYAFRTTFQVSGYLQGSSQAALSTAQSQLESQLKLPNQSIVLYQDNGTTTTPTALNAGVSISGINVTKWDFPGKDGNEYATQREFMFTAWGEFPLNGKRQTLLSFKETVSFAGGGPLYVVKLAISGPNQRQLVYPNTAYTATQSGEATGYLQYPTVPGPTWPDWMKDSPGDLVRDGPDRFGVSYQKYKVRWVYRFEATVPLIGVPNIWGKA